MALSEDFEFEGRPEEFKQEVNVNHLMASASPNRTNSAARTDVRGGRDADDWLDEGEASLFHEEDENWNEEQAILDSVAKTKSVEKSLLPDYRNF